MKRRMEQLQNGRYNFQAPKLVLSDASLHLTVEADDSLQGEFFFAAEDNSRIKGMLSCSHRRIVLEKDKFSGNAIHVRYCIDTRGLKNGDYFKGDIVISSPLEERILPVEVKVEEKKAAAFGDSVRTLDAFVRLAKNDLREAFRLYTDPAFSRLLRGKDAAYATLYKGMSRNPVTYQHLEEFLVAAGKKEAVSLTMDKEERLYEDVRRSFKDTLYIYKNTWGYTRMEVETTGDFLEVEKKVVTAEDFIGSVYGLEYVIKKDRLRKGRNYGRITLHTVYQTYVFLLEVSVPSDRDEEAALQKKSYTFLLRQLLNYQLGMIPASELKDRTADLLKQNEQQKKMDLFQYLYLAYVYLINNQMTEALAACWPAKDVVFTPQEDILAALTLYMKKKTGLLDTVEEDIVPRLETMYAKHADNFALLWMLLDLHPEYSDTRKMFELEKIAEKGCNSPYLYAAVYNLYRENLDQLRKLSPLAMNTLKFASRKGILNEKIASKTALLAQYQKNFTRDLYRLLCDCYDICPTKEVLTAIVRLIMMERPERKEYFRWYAMAVDAQIRMTRLYEYYIETLCPPFGDVLPQVIRLYFSYNNKLSDSKKAFVYANVIRNKDKDRVTYSSYRTAMSHFAVEQLQKGKINENYAVIYDEFITDLDSPALAEAMNQVLFTDEIEIQDRKIRQVVVLSPYLEKELVYPVKEGRAYIKAYTGDETILFEDGQQRRYGTTVAYTRKTLLSARKYVPLCCNVGIVDFGILAHLYLPELNSQEVTEKSIEQYLRISEEPRFCPECRYEARTHILEFYARHEKEELPDAISRLIIEDGFARRNKVLVAKVMMQRGMIVGAYDLISKYGYENIDTKTLYTVCTRLIEDSHYAENEEVTHLALELYERKKTNETILTYLRDNYVGTLDSMEKVRNAIREKGIDTQPLDEELLILSMYVRRSLHRPEEILRGYESGTTNALVKDAFLIFCSFNWFMAGESLTEGILSQTEELILRTPDVNPVCRLAVLKAYSVQKQLTKEQMDMTRNLLEWAHKENIRFAFYQKLPAELIQAYQLEDRLFIEENAPDAEKITIYYRMGGEGEFKSEPMKDMFQGIFVKEFLLFYGEIIEYYLVRESRGSKERTATRKASREYADTEGRTKYQLLNRMLAQRRLKHPDEFEETMKEYLKMDALSEKAFILM